MKLDKKQKILLTLVILAVAYLAWQMYDIFFANRSEAIPATSAIIQAPSEPILRTSPAPTTSTVPSISNSAPTAATTVTSVTVPVRPMTAVPPPSPTAPSQPPAYPAMQQMTLQAPMTAQQQEYLRLVNRYQLIKMQRMVADEEAAMYSSRAKVAELSQKISTIGGAGPISGSLVDQPMTSSTIGYQLMYIDFQNGQWTATLNQSGRFIEVTEGRVLADGARILRINQNGVVIRKWNKNYLLNFYGTTILRNNANYAPTASVRTINARYVPITAVKVTQPIAKPKPAIQKIVKPAAIPHSLAANGGITNFNSLSRFNNQEKSAEPLRIARSPAPSAIPSITTTVPPAVTPSTPIATVETKVLSPLMPANKAETNAQNINQKEMPLTQQQKNTVTQLETYLDRKKPLSPDSYSIDEKHLLSLPAEYFTIQLLGSNKLSDLVNFIKAHHLQDKAYTFHTYYMDKDWYVLIYGVYKTEQEALNAISTLPPAIQNIKPWVRTIDSVSEAIKLNPKQAG